LQLEPLGIHQFQAVVLALLGLVDHLEAVDVFDQALAVFTEHASVFGHIQRHHRPFNQRYHQRRDHHQQHGTVADQARPEQVGLATLQLMLTGVTDQATGIAHFVHDRITGVDAGRTTNAFHLQAVADVDARGANLNAQLAIDAIAKANLGWLHVTFTRATMLAAGGVVGNGQGVLIKHYALEPCIGAHVHAHRFA